VREKRKKQKRRKKERKEREEGTAVEGGVVVPTTKSFFSRLRAS